MTARTQVLHFDYVERPWSLRVEAVCRSWAGTPYKLGRCVKQRYVDCIHLGAAVLDELYGIDHSKNLKSLPPDACIHNRPGVQKALRSLLRSYPSHRRVRDATLEAGDLVITGPLAGGPSHLLIASRRGALWEASPAGVRTVGYGILSTERLVAVYRAGDKNLW
jgi:hypothetical protein